MSTYADPELVKALIALARSKFEGPHEWGGHSDVYHSEGTIKLAARDNLATAYAEVVADDRLSPHDEVDAHLPPKPAIERRAIVVPLLDGIEALTKIVTGDWEYDHR